jgi:hypothetical protein
MTETHRQALALDEARADRDRQHTRAAARAELLPFGDGYLDDDRPDFHGTSVGWRRHIDAGERFCRPCAEFVLELIHAGLAGPIGAKR